MESSIPNLTWWILTGLVAALVIVLWWAAARFISTTQRNLENQGKSIEIQHTSIEVLFEKVKSLNKESLMTQKRLNTHADTIRRIDKNQVLISSELGHLKKS